MGQMFNAFRHCNLKSKKKGTHFRITAQHQTYLIYYQVSQEFIHPNIKASENILLKEQMTKTCIVACNCNPTSSFKFYSLDIAPTCLSHWTTALRFLVARTSRRNWQQNLACTDSRVPLAPLKLHVRLKLTCQHIKQKIHSNK